MLFSFLIHSRRVAETLPVDNLTATQHVAQAVAFTAAFIGLIAAVAYFWADRKDQKEIDELLRKNGIRK